MESHNYKVYYGVFDPEIFTNRTNSPYSITLEDDILKNGIRNPILAVANYDLYNKEWANGKFFVDNYGGSRLQVAKRHSIQIPAFISVYGEIDTLNLTQITTTETALKYITDKPADIGFFSHQFYYYYYK